ncbi:MAG TPA: hypothetical protein VMR81_01360 [Patescibacteria group bacterium]|nr:hypothetical protein [Patescibacteria group bacterium]
MVNLENDSAAQEGSVTSEPLHQLSNEATQLIDLAMSKVRKGSIGTDGSQTVFLRHGRHLYRITDEQVEVEKVGPIVTAVHSKGSLRSGLHVVIIADEPGGYFFSVDLPRSSKENFDEQELHQLGEKLYPHSTVHLTAAQIKETKRTTKANWERVLRSPWY